MFLLAKQMVLKQTANGKQQMKKLLPVVSTAADEMGQDLHYCSANCMRRHPVLSEMAAACVKTRVFYELRRQVRDYLTVQALLTQTQCFFSIVSTAFQAFLFSSPPTAFVGLTRQGRIAQRISPKIKNLAAAVQLRCSQ